LATDSPAAGKRGDLTGGALTDEALASSKSVLSPTLYGSKQRGLQQFFTKPDAATFIQRVIDPATQYPVADITAGSGALLAPWPKDQQYGVEVDRDWTLKSEYEAITGDIQRVFPMLFKLGIKFNRLVTNPPFGLDWTIGGGKEVSSSVAAWRMSLALLEPHGVGAFLCGRDRFAKEIATREDAAGAFATVDCPDLFEGVELPCMIAFFIQPDNRGDYSTGVTLALESDLAGLASPELQAELRGALEQATLEVSQPGRRWGGPTEAWKMVDREVTRRRREEERNQPTYDVELRSGDRLSVKPKPFVRKALANAKRLKLVETLHNQPIGHFALNGLDWRLLKELEDECELSLAPAVAAAVEQITSRAELEVIPLYEVRPQMRLGYLTDLDSISCTRSDPERGFHAGETYPLKTDSEIHVEGGRKVTYNKDGEPVVRKYEEERKVLLIKIADEQFCESSEDIGYILGHFDVPNPGDIATRFPEEVERQRQALDEIAAKGRQVSGDTEFQWKRFQREDLSRALTKTRDGGGFILSWEQGGGKTLGAAGYALGSVKNGARNQVLFIVPQDLIPQYREDIKDKLGIEVEHITSPKQARSVARHLAAGGEGWYITHYEVLSLLGVKNQPLPECEVTTRGSDGRRVMLPSSEFCPRCHAAFDDGWQRNSPLVCSAVHTEEVNGETRTRTCGYIHKRLKVKSAAHYLAAAFKDGVICIDEGTLIKGDTSQRSKAIRCLRARNKLLATGTPISNYVNQIFWLMWWCLGDASLRFPYSYEGGLAAFESDFCVIQYLHGREGTKTQNRREQRKVLPQITNVSRFWRLAAGAMIRRRKVDFGEPLVPCTLKTVSVPMGVAQRELYERWLDPGAFASFFEWKYPDHALVKSGQIERFAAGCGQLTKLEYATTAPEAATDRGWPGITGYEHCNWTPKNLKTLELILKHVEAGEKILVGSDLIETGRWLCERLKEKGVKAGHIVEEKDGKAATVNPKKRARVMREFRHGGLQVLLCGIPAIRLGHNLDTASVVVVDGLVFSYEMFDQFIARAHRLSSKKPVTVYVMLTKDSLDEKKWALLCAKAEAADLALDGQLMDEREDPISLEEFLKQLQRDGVPVTGNEVPEADLHARWEGVPTIKLTGKLPTPQAPDLGIVNEGPAPMPAKYRPITPITSSEQISLFT
jgi:SNF2 domain-containing protein/helicase-like protein